MKPSARPTRVVRFFVEGEPVDAETFYEAIRAAGGQALVTAHDPKPLEPGYRLTPAGRAALRRAEERAPESGGAR
jgi:hypothetical protein